MSRRTVNIVGVGNTLMGDDGVGPAAVERLLARGLPEGACAYDAGLAVSDVLGLLDPADPLVIVDAVKVGGQAGSIYEARIDLGADEEACKGEMFSLHEISALPALRLEAITGRVFSDVTVLGVEPGVVEWGEGLSPAVAAVLDRLVERVHACATRALRAAPGPRGQAACGLAAVQRQKRSR